ncbi:MAG TPA: DEAD/DEAH box helicase [Cyclobacteriaceae bacterium]|nr:DEAD/DEAH box helicase [Cyclobacteriaceae bacterium]
MSFVNFNFEASLQEGLDAMGFTKPTPIQEQAIPLIQEGKDLIATAQTGTGKTAAFILPILNKIAKTGSSQLNTLILAPTRELAVQIDQQIQGFAYFLGISSISIYGGGDGIVWEQQKKALEEGAEIVVATPGRLIALLAGGKINLSTLEHLILDEADRMMDMGFSDDILKIVNYLPKKRQTVLFSATMPPKIRKFSQQLLQNPEEINIALGKTAKGITQSSYMVYDNQKEALVKHILSQKEYEAVIIFCSTKDKVKSLYKVLKKDFEIEAFHSDLEQVEREKIMSAFKNRSLKILVGTDIISRGIDVVGIELVINYDTPSDPEDYVHRVGRTARADSNGEAITFVNEKDKFKYSNIEKLIGMEINKLVIPEHIGTAPTFSSSTSKSNGQSRNGGGKSKVKKTHSSPRAKHPKREGVKPQSTSPAPSKTVRENIVQPVQEKRKDVPSHEGTKTSSKFRSRKNVEDGE